jgi:hypothetical protein
LIELERVEELVQLAVLLHFLELDKVLLQAVERELRLVVDEDLEWLRRTMRTRGGNGRQGHIRLP